MKLDQEFEVLSRCHELLNPLDNEVKARILTWLSSKFRLGYSSITIASDVATASNGGGQQQEEEMSEGTESTAANTGSNGTASSGELSNFKSFNDMYKYLKPSSDAEKALAAAVFLTSNKQMTEISSAQVQKELKMIDERVSNITQAISALVKKKYVTQLGKDGDSQQARKKYQVTPEAEKQVLNLLSKR